MCKRWLMLDQWWILLLCMPCRWVKWVHISAISPKAFLSIIFNAFHAIRLSLFFLLSPSSIRFHGENVWRYENYIYTITFLHFAFILLFRFLYVHLLSKLGIKFAHQNVNTFGRILCLCVFFSRLNFLFFLYFLFCSWCDVKANIIFFSFLF